MAMFRLSVSCGSVSSNRICTIGRSITHEKRIFKVSRIISNGTPTQRWYTQEVNHPEERMSFEEYRKLRRSLKWRGRIAGIPMTFLAIAASSAVNIHLNPDMFNPQPEAEIPLILGMDPVIFAALCGAACGVGGFALGGIIFNTTWRTIYSKAAKLLQDREDDFLSRLQRHRYSRFDQSKYDDDYYAEKVMTLSDYRQWIRQQQMKKQADAERERQRLDGEREGAEEEEAESHKLR